MFNINSHVYVKLTEKGILHFVNKHNEIADKIKHLMSVLTIEEFASRADADGYHEFQMHEFMEVYGDTVISDTLFYTNVFFKKSELKIPANPEDIKAVDGFITRSKEDIQLPDGIYYGRWNVHRIKLLYVHVKGLEHTTYRFQPMNEPTEDHGNISEYRKLGCKVKVIVKNKRGYVYLNQ